MTPVTFFALLTAFRILVPRLYQATPPGITAGYFSQLYWSSMQSESLSQQQVTVFALLNVLWLLVSRLCQAFPPPWLLESTAAHFSEEHLVSTRSESLTLAFPALFAFSFMGKHYLSDGYFMRRSPPAL